MLTVLCATAVAYTPGSTAADVNPTAATAPALPPVATREAVRDLLSHLSDVQVRNLLIEQLDKTVADAVNPGADTGTAAMAGMAGTVDQHAGAMRSRYDTLYDALVALPATMRDVAHRVAGSGVVTPARLAAYVVALLMAGWVAERIYVRALRPYRSRVLGAGATTFSARAFALGIGFLIDFGALLVFGVAAIVFFFSLWLPQELQRIFVLELLFAVFVVRVVALFARFLLANETGRARLLPFADAPARRLRGFAVALAVVYGVGFATSSVVGAASASAETVDLLGVGFWIVGLLVTLAAVWSSRKPIADLIRGAGNRGAVVGWLADLWPVVATAYFVALLMSGLFNVLAGAAITTGTAFASVLLFVTLPIVDMALCRALAAAAGSRGIVDTPEPRVLGALRADLPPCHPCRRRRRRSAPDRAAVGPRPVRACADAAWAARSRARCWASASCCCATYMAVGDRQDCDRPPLVRRRRRSRTTSRRRDCARCCRSCARRSS